MTAGTLAAQAVVIAKEPVPGRVKTRLTPPFTPAEAALLAEAALADTLAAVAASPVSRHVLALDGARGDWLPAGGDGIPRRGRHCPLVPVPPRRACAGPVGRAEPPAPLGPSPAVRVPHPVPPGRHGAH